VGIRASGEDRPARRGGRGEIEKAYTYYDAHGELVFEVVRFKGKRFRQRRPAGPGRWEWSIEGLRRPPYHAPFLEENAARPAAQRRVVFFVEGEKDADNLAAAGFLTTTTSGGAGNAHLTDLGLLHGCHVCILPDNDPVNPRSGRRPGWDHAQHVAGLLSGHAASVRVVRLPVAEGQDVTDWLESFKDAGGAFNANVARTALAALYKQTPPWQPEGPPVHRFAVITTEAAAKLREADPTAVGSRNELWGLLEIVYGELRAAHLAAGRRGADERAFQEKAAELAGLLARGFEDLGWLGGQS
jgi:hypothetical protein